MTITVQILGSNDHALFHGMLDVFAEAFQDEDSYSSNRPMPDYISSLLNSDSFVGIVAVLDDHVIGGLAAYELRKFEQARSEFYIYDLAVLENHRRAGVATRMIEALKPIAASRKARIIFVQADYGDDPAIALYTKLGLREEVLHFDIHTD